MNNIERVKSKKYFTKFDIVLYLIIIVALAVTLLVVFLPQKPNLQKVVASVDGQEVFTYDYLTDTLTVTDYGKEITTVEKGETITVCIATEYGNNAIAIDKDSAYVKDADCSARADCVNNFAKITSGGQGIYCLPHKLQVIGYGKMGGTVVL